MFANSFIQGRKVDSPKIFLGNQIGDERPKTSAQQTRKVKTKECTKEAKKKSSHQRKNATALNASQVVAPSNSIHANKALFNNLAGGLHTNKEVESRKFDFGLPPHLSNKLGQTSGSASQSKKKTSIARSQNSKMHRH